MQYYINCGVGYFAILLVTRLEYTVNMSTNRDLTDAELLCVAAATALPPSPASSPVRSLASQLHILAH